MTRPLGWLSPDRYGRPHAGRVTAPSPGLTLPSHVRLDAPAEAYDQRQVGSCVAQALACAAEILAPRAGYAPERPDRTALYYRARRAIGTTREDSGAIIADGIEVLRRLRARLPQATLVAGLWPANDAIVGAAGTGDPDLRRAMAVDVDARYPTAAAFRDALLAYLANNGGKAMPEEIGKAVSALFEDRRAAIAEIHRVLRPGGRFFFEDVTKHALDRWAYRTFLEHPSEDRFGAFGFVMALEAQGLHVGDNALTRVFGDFVFGVATKTL